MDDLAVIFGALIPPPPPEPEPTGGYADRLRPITGTYGDVVEAREALTDEPAIWLSVNDRLDATGQSAQLGPEAVDELIEQLVWLREHHLRRVEERCREECDTLDSKHPSH